MKGNARQFIDLSHSVSHGLMTYEGLPPPIISDHLSREASRQRYAPGTEFHIGKIEMVANTGTYLDAPFHRFANGKDLSELPLTSIADIEGIMIRVDSSDGRSIGADVFKRKEVSEKAVLVYTGWSVHWGTDRYFEGHPFLTEDAARYMVSSGAILVGIDSLNIDDISDGRRPVHILLLKNEIPIVEHLTNLENLPEHGFKFFAVPVKVKGLGSFPVRAFALANGSMGPSRS